MESITQWWKEPSVWAVIVFIGLIIWTERKTILPALFGFLNRRQVQAEQAQEADQEIETAYRARLQQNGANYTVMVERALQMLQEQQNAYQRMFVTERVERQTANQMVIDSARTTQHLGASSVEVMGDFASVARTMVTKWDERNVEFLSLLDRIDKTVAGIGFVLAKLYFQDEENKTFDDLATMLEE